MAKASRGSEQFPLRLPDGLRDRVKEKADANGRSMNAEIIAAIESTIDLPDLSASDLRKMLDEERAIGAQVSKVMEELFAIVDDYRRVNDNARSQLIEKARLVSSLCNIIRLMGPSPEVSEFVERLQESSREFLDRVNNRDPADPVETSPDSLNSLAERIHELVKLQA